MYVLSLLWSVVAEYHQSDAVVQEGGSQGCSGRVWRSSTGCPAEVTARIRLNEIRKGRLITAVNDDHEDITDRNTKGVYWIKKRLATSCRGPTCLYMLLTLNTRSTRDAPLEPISFARSFNNTLVLLAALPQSFEAKSDCVFGNIDILNLQRRIHLDVFRIDIL